MNTISISGRGLADATAVPDSFLTGYMPQANGEFVKVYLLVLMESQRGRTVTSCQLADLLSAPESDVTRALMYWKKQGLLTFGEQTGPESTAPAESDVSKVPEESHASGSEKKAEPGATPQGTADSRIHQQAENSAPPERQLDPDDSRREVVSRDFVLTDEQGDEGVISISRTRKPTAVTREQLAEKMGDPEFAALIKIAQSLLKTNLKNDDVDHLIYFYDGLHFPTDMIEYLIALSIDERGKKDFRYMQGIAERWYQEGIRTAKDAREEAQQHSSTVHTVFREFGLDRKATPTDLRFIERWKKTYQMSDELIAQACSRTIHKTQKASFDYADRILEEWSREGVHDQKTLDLSDAAYRLKSAEKAKQKAQEAKIAAAAAGQKSASSIAGFTQRTDDLDALAIQLQIESSQ